MTEEDTFKALKRWTYEQVEDYLSKTNVSTIKEYKAAMEKAGWTLTEFVAVETAKYNALFNDDPDSNE